MKQKKSETEFDYKKRGVEQMVLKYLNPCTSIFPIWLFSGFLVLSVHSHSHWKIFPFASPYAILMKCFFSVFRCVFSAHSELELFILDIFLTKGKVTQNNFGCRLELNFKCFSIDFLLSIQVWD